MVWVDLEGLPASHHGKLVLVLEGLGLHHLLLLGGVAELGGHHNHRRAGEPLGDLHLLNLDACILHGTTLGEVRELLLPPVCERLVHVFHLGKALLLLLGLIQLHVSLLDRHELLALVISQLLKARLVKGVRQHQHLDILFHEDLEGRCLLHDVQGVARHVVDALLALLHAVKVLVQADLLAVRLGRVVAEQLRQLRSIGIVLIAAHLEVLVELLPELRPCALLILRLLLHLCLVSLLLLLIIISARLLVLGQLLHELQHFAHQLLGDDLHDLVLLQLLTGHVQGKVIRVHHATHEVEVARKQLVELLGHQNAAHKELHLRPFLPVVVHHVEWCLLGQVEDGLELDLALCVEVRVSQRVQVVLGDALVELVVLLLSDVLLGSQPDGLLGVHLLPLMDRLLRWLLVHLLLLLLLILGLHVVLLLLIILLVIVIVILLGIHIHLLLHLHVDGELDELGVLLAALFELVLREVVVSILLEVQGHTAATAQCVAAGVIHHCEGGIGAGLPHVLHWVIVALGGHGDLVCHQEGRVEADAELTDEVGIPALGHGLQEVGGSGLGDCSQVVDEVGLGHAHACVHDGDGLGVSIVLDLDLQVLEVPEEGLILHAVEARLLERVGRVRDELSQEDVLVCVKRVDDDVHETAHLSLELVLL
mmetsp:Transcript_42364/g.76600  ORF Transcript_42364/g.76600 Transcript_42364/m.76600 type:complete len:651 (+) Transcript_42364:522-2474(+)